MKISEGFLEIEIPDKPGFFYNPRGKLSRDFGVLLLKVESKIKGKKLKVLDLFGGMGIRSLRYMLETDAVDELYFNDAYPEVVNQAKKNFEKFGFKNIKYFSEEATHLLAKFYYQREEFDWIDFDSFGSPVEFLDYTFRMIKNGGILYLTSTDGTVLCGRNTKALLRLYNAFSFPSEFVHETGIRILYRKIMEIAHSKGKYIEPVFALFDGYSFRLAVRVKKGREIVNKNIGFVCRCPNCFETYLIDYQNFCSFCPKCGQKIYFSGPLYYSDIHSKNILEMMLKECTDEKTKDVIKKMLEEIDMPPFYYHLDRVSEYLKVSTPKRRIFIKILRRKGYLVKGTHFMSNGIKTDAPTDVVKEVVKFLNKKGEG